MFQMFLVKGKLHSQRIYCGWCDLLAMAGCRLEENLKKIWSDGAALLVLDPLRGAWPKSASNDNYPLTRLSRWPNAR